MTTKTIYEWFLECIYIQRTSAWQSWAGAGNFLMIKNGIKDSTGMSEIAFWNWIERIKRYGSP
jgi:hypothetical protein